MDFTTFNYAYIIAKKRQKGRMNVIIQISLLMIQPICVRASCFPLQTEWIQMELRSFYMLFISTHAK